MHSSANYQRELVNVRCGAAVPSREQNVTSHCKRRRRKSGKTEEKRVTSVMITRSFAVDLLLFKRESFTLHRKYRSVESALKVHCFSFALTKGSI